LRSDDRRSVVSHYLPAYVGEVSGTAPDSERYAANRDDQR
jgi:hypothetical protein